MHSQLKKLQKLEKNILNRFKNQILPYDIPSVDLSYDFANIAIIEITNLHIIN